MKILIVDDNKLNQRLMVSTLKRYGYDIDLASNGAEAVELYLKNDYRFIIMDIMMPVMDGLEATRNIRRTPKNRKNHIPIIALTANTLDADRERCLASGCDEYIAKPLDIKKLNKAISKLGIN